MTQTDEGNDMATRKHGFTAEVTERDWNHRATRWRGRCGRHEEWFGATYEEIEDAWRQHVHGETGNVPKAMGDKADRWSPPVPA